MFSEVNNGKGITEDLELYLVTYLTEKHDVKGFARASAYVLEDQTTFIGFDIKTLDNKIWSQQNIFSVDDENKVIGVEGNYSESSEKNVIKHNPHSATNLPVTTRQRVRGVNSSSSWFPSSSSCRISANPPSGITMIQINPATNQNGPELKKSIGLSRPVIFE